MNGKRTFVKYAVFALAVLLASCNDALLWLGDNGDIKEEILSGQVTEYNFYYENPSVNPDTQKITAKHQIGAVLNGSEFFPNITQGGYKVGNWVCFDIKSGEVLTPPNLHIDGEEISFHVTQKPLSFYIGKWKPNDDIPYKINHYKQNLGLTDYELAETETKGGTTGSTISAEGNEKHYEGFVTKTCTPQEIAGDGSTEISIYYDRRQIQITINGNGGTFADGSTSKEFNGYYGQAIEIPEITKTDDSLAGYKNIVTMEFVETLETFPAQDGTYNAYWKNSGGGIDQPPPDEQDYILASELHQYLIDHAGQVKVKVKTDSEDDVRTMEEAMKATDINATGLDLVIVGDITEISKYAFEACTLLTSVEIPDTLTDLGYYPFEGCTSLASIIVSDSHPTYSSEGGVLYNKDKSTLVRYPPTKTGASYTIQRGVTSIGSYAFEGCTSLASIIFEDKSNWWTSNYSESYDNPINVDDAATNAINLITKWERDPITYEFEGWKGYNLNKNIHAWTWNADTRKYTCSHCGVSKTSLNPGEIVSYLMSRGSGAATVVAKVTEETTPYGLYNNTYTIGQALKNKNVNVSGIDLEFEGVFTKISNSAFYGCTKLTSVKIPKCVTSIEAYAFSGCTSLTSVTFADTDGWCADSSETLNYEDPIGVYDAGANATNLTTGEWRGKYLHKNPAGGHTHTFATTWTFDETDHWHRATCGHTTEVKDKAPHTLDSGVPSTTENGTTIYTCNICKKTKLIHTHTIVYNWTSNETHHWYQADCGIEEHNEDKAEHTWNAGTCSVCGKEKALSPDDVAAYLADCVAKGETDVSIVVDFSEVSSTETSTNLQTIRNAIRKYDNDTVITSVDLELTGMSITTIPSSSSSGAFANCKKLTSVKLPDNLTSIGQYAFRYCSALTSVKLPDNLTNISNFAFDGCSALTSVEIPARVTSIGAFAFRNCSLTSVEIPAKVTSIGEGAFTNCSKLTSFYVESGNTKYLSEDGVLFNKDKTSLVAYPVGNSRTSYIIPLSVTSIEDYAFYSCSKLTTVEIPASVTSIGKEAFYNCSALTSMKIPANVTSIGEGAFTNCSAITSFYVESGNTNYVSEDDVLFDYEKKTLIYYPAANSRTSYSIPAGVTEIGASAFRYCSAITSVDIPATVTSIGDYAFEYCSKLTSVTVRNPTPPTLGSSAFYGNVVNRYIYVPAGSVYSYKNATNWKEYVYYIEQIS